MKATTLKQVRKFAGAENAQDEEAQKPPVSLPPLPGLCATRGCGREASPHRRHRQHFYCAECYAQIVSDRVWRIKQIRKRRGRIPRRIAFSVAAIFACIDAELSASIPWSSLWLIMAVQAIATWMLIDWMSPLWEEDK